MPRVVRNFWFEAHVDGKKHKVTGGPRAADGGFSLYTYQRNQGDIECPVEIVGRAISNDILQLTVYMNGQHVAWYDTER